MTHPTATIQIAIDSADPHRLNRFWAAALGYEVEDHHDMIGQIVATGAASLEEDTIEIDGRRAWKTAAACSDPARRGPRLLFQRVPEPKSVKDRIHLDLHFAPGDDAGARGGGRAPDRARRHEALGRRAGPAAVGHDGRSGGQRVLRRLTSRRSNGPSPGCPRRTRRCVFGGAAGHVAGSSAERLPTGRSLEAER